MPRCPRSSCLLGTQAEATLLSALVPPRQAAAVRPLTQGFLSRGLVAWRAHKHAAAKPSGGAARADRAGAAAQGPEPAAEEAVVRAALVLTYSQRCQVRAGMLWHSLGSACRRGAAWQL